MSHSSTRAGADPRTADLCTRRIYFVRNEIASCRLRGPLVALWWAGPCGERAHPGSERKRAVANNDRRSRIAVRPERI